LHGLGDFTSGIFFWRPFGAVSWCIIKMEAEISKRLHALAVAEISFDFQQNRCTKGCASYRIRVSKGRGLWMPDVGQTTENRV
jgi:hypothetical protein